MKPRLLFLALLFLSSPIATHADIVLSDTFTYPNGNITELIGSPWVPHSGAGNGPVQVSGGQLRVTGGSAEDVNALLADGPYLASGSAVLYSSFKMRATAKPGNLGTYFAHFMDTNTGAATGFGARVWVSATNAYAGGLITANNQYRVGVANGTSGGAQSGQIDADLTLNTTYTIVTRFVPATGVATIWLNPVVESDPGVTATDEGTGTRPNPIDVVAYALRQASGQGTIFVDDLRIATSFADAVSTNNQPVVTAIANLNTGAGIPTAAIPFTIGDIETPAGSLVLSAASSNPALVPVENIVFGGSDSNRTVTVTPAPGQQGTTTITITVTDGDAGKSSRKFVLAVGLPVISDIASQIVPADATLGPIAFTVGDTETPLSGLTVTASSANQSLLLDGNIIIDGVGADRTLSATPSPGQSGLVLVTVTVSDGQNQASDTFALTVHPNLGVLRSDDFNLSDGPLVRFDGQWLSNGGTGGTNLQQMQIVSAQAQVTGTQSEDCSTELPPGQTTAPSYPPAGGYVFYASMKIDYRVLPNAAGAYFAHFRDNSSGFRGRIYAATTGAASGHYRVGIANSANLITAPAIVATDLATNQQYAIVVRYNVATGESRLWLNPASETSPGVNAVDGAQPVTVEAFTFRQNSDIGTVLVDDLKIGTAFSDVAEVRYSLTITTSGGAVDVSWPTAAAGYSLQFTESLSPAVWVPFSGTVTAEGDRNVARIVGPTGNQFFRLAK